MLLLTAVLTAAGSRTSVLISTMWDKSGSPFLKWNKEMGPTDGRLTYMPRVKVESGMVDDCAFYTSLDGKLWTLAAEKKVENLLVESAKQPVQLFLFPTTQARYFKFVAQHVLKDDFAAVAEIGVVEMAGE